MLNITKAQEDALLAASSHLKETKLTIYKDQIRLFQITHKAEINNLSKEDKQLFHDFYQLTKQLFENLI